MKPLFTVITVVYNGEKYIEQTIKSVITQKFKNFEYIIVDGASTDNTLKIIKKYQNQIDCLISEPDESLYDAMNKGIRLSKGIYVNLLNCGDFYPNKNILSGVHKTIHRNKRVDVLVGKAKKITNDGKPYRLWPNKVVLTSNNWTRFDDPCHQAIFYRKKLHEKYGYYDLNFKCAADTLFIYKMLTDPQLNKIKYNQIVVNFRVDGLSSSEESILERKKVYDLVYGKSIINELLILKYKLKTNRLGNVIFKFYLRIKELIKGINEK